MSIRVALGAQLKTNALAKVAEIVIIFATAIIFIFALLSSKPEDSLYNQMVIWFANVLVLALIWLGAWLRAETLADFGLDMPKLNVKKVAKGLGVSIIVLVLALVGFVLGSVIMVNITGMPTPADLSGYDYLKNNLGLFLMAMAGIYFVSSFGEEVIYRGFLINRVIQLGSDNRTTKIIAVIISSIIFGLIHYGWGPMGIVQTGLMGVALGACYLYLGKRLWPLIMAHVYLDTMLIAPIYFQS